jgi:hypothetical protein
MRPVAGDTKDLRIRESCHVTELQQAKIKLIAVSNLLRPFTAKRVET